MNWFNFNLPWSVRCVAAQCLCWQVEGGATGTRESEDHSQIPAMAPAPIVGTALTLLLRGLCLEKQLQGSTSANLKIGQAAQKRSGLYQHWIFKAKKGCSTEIENNFWNNSASQTQISGLHAAAIEYIFYCLCYARGQTQWDNPLLWP